MKDYYHILGVHEASSDAEVKSRFRELALRYHPDQNEDPAAHKRFLEINEAYETLIDPQKKVIYKYQFERWKRRQQKPRQNPSHKSWQPGYAPPPRTSDSYRPRYPRSESSSPVIHPVFIQTARAAQILSIVALLFSLLVLLDFFSAQRLTGEEVLEIDIRKSSVISNTMALQVRTTHELFPLSILKQECLSKGDIIALTRTRIFRIVRVVEVSISCQSAYRFSPYQGIYGGPFFLIFLLIILSLIPWLSRGQVMVSTFGGILILITGSVALGILLNS